MAIWGVCNGLCERFRGFEAGSPRQEPTLTSMPCCPCRGEMLHVRCHVSILAQQWYIVVIGSNEYPDEWTCAASTATSAWLPSVGTTNMGVTCCNAGGTGTRPDCVQGDYSSAKAGCEANGLTLCTSTQLLNGAGGGTGCQFNHVAIWSSDPCGMPYPNDPIVKITTKITI